MAHQSLKLQPGVDSNLTPAYNESGISASNLIRFLPDPSGRALVQSLGGWVPYYATPIASTVYNIWPWEDINTATHLAVGSAGGTGLPALTVIQNNASAVLQANDITPQQFTLSTPMTTAVVTTTAGSPFVLFTIAGSEVTPFDSVIIETPVAAGGLILYGLYPIIAGDGNTEFTIEATDVLGNPLPAYWTTTSAPTTAASGTGTTATLTYSGGFLFPSGAIVTIAGVTPTGYNAVDVVETGSSGSVSYANPTTGAQTVAGTISTWAQLPQYTTANGSAIVSVLLPNHGYTAGVSTFPALVSTTLGGVTILGEYQVASVVSQSVFTIVASKLATSNATAFENGNNIAFQFYAGQGALPNASGYGIGGYGTGIAGTAHPSTNIVATDWTLANWGNILLACPFGGPIFMWDPTQTTLTNPVNATVIAQAPPANAGMFVAMPERQIVAWGSTVTGIMDPLLIRWCDVENFTVWAGQPTNQAGEYRIPTGSKIIGGGQTPQQGLFWTDIGVWAQQYVGQPFIYSFTELGRGCGLVAPKAFGVLGGQVFWMSQNQFFVLVSGLPEPLPCPVWDIAFQDLDTAQLGAIRCATNSYFNEIAWYFPVIGSNGINTKYVKFNYVLQAWDYGTLGRAAWTDQSVLGAPIGAGTDNFLYQHEVGSTANGAPMASSFTTGYFSMNEGDMKVFIDEIWPDMKWGQYQGAQNAQVDVTFSITDYPNQPPVVYGPYSFNATSTYLTPRMRGRLMAITVRSAPANTTFWRLGNLRYRAMPDGKY